MGHLRGAPIELSDIILGTPDTLPAWTQALQLWAAHHGFTFHDLRHTANLLAASTGASTAVLMARMGHASPRAALRYQHATRDRDAAIAEVMSAAVAAVAPSVAS